MKLAGECHQDDGSLVGYCNHCGGPCFNYIDPRKHHRCPPKSKAELVALAHASQTFVTIRRDLGGTTHGSFMQSQMKEREEKAFAELAAAVEAIVAMQRKPL